MPLIVEKLREIQRNSDFWTECPKVQNLQLNMEPLTSGHCVQKQKEFCYVFSYISKLFLYEKNLEKERGKILCSSEDSHFSPKNKEDL